MSRELLNNHPNFEKLKKINCARTNQLESFDCFVKLEIYCLDDTESSKRNSYRQNNSYHKNNNNYTRQNLKEYNTTVTDILKAKKAYIDELGGLIEAYSGLISSYFVPCEKKYCHMKLDFRSNEMLFDPTQHPEAVKDATRVDYNETQNRDIESLQRDINEIQTNMSNNLENGNPNVSLLTEKRVGSVVDTDPSASLERGLTDADKSSRNSAPSSLQNNRGPEKSVIKTVRPMVERFGDLEPATLAKAIIKCYGKLKVDRFLRDYKSKGSKIGKDDKGNNERKPERYARADLIKGIKSHFHDMGEGCTFKQILLVLKKDLVPNFLHQQRLY